MKTLSLAFQEARRTSRLTHGMYGTATYRSWSDMHTRCSNPRFKDFAAYGGRGITVCERWRSFEDFYTDMGERPAGTTLDRIDTNGNYEPGNCRWATQCQQQRNRTNNKLTPERVEEIKRLRDQGMTQRQIAARFGVCQRTVSCVLRGITWA